MSILSRFSNLLTSMIPSADQNYSTIVYPIRGVGIILHDDLGIADERPSFHQIITPPESATHEPGVFTVMEAYAPPQDSLEACDLQQEDVQPFDLYHVCGIGGALGDDNIGLFKNGPLLSTRCFGGDSMDINPGSGLPMLDGCIDVAGNPFGCDNSSSGLFDDGW